MRLKSFKLGLFLYTPKCYGNNLPQLTLVRERSFSPWINYKRTFHFIRACTIHTRRSSNNNSNNNNSNSSNNSNNNNNRRTISLTQMQTRRRRIGKLQIQQGVTGEQQSNNVVSPRVACFCSSSLLLHERGGLACARAGVIERLTMCEGFLFQK